MGLLNKKDDDAGKALEKMMDKFDIDLDDILEESEDSNSEINKRRREKIEKEKLGF